MSGEIDDWLDGGIIVDDGLRVPLGGWDNACDIPAAKTVVRDSLGVITSGPKGLDKIDLIALPLYDLGISPDLGADLIDSIQDDPPHHRDEVCAAIRHFYECLNGPGPGLRSKALPREEEWAAPDDDDGSWLEGGPAVWPKPLQYDAKQHNAKLAEAFLAERPAKLISSDDVIYSLEGGTVWREVSARELAAEMRKTDPAMTLDTRRLLAMVDSIHVERYTKARPFEWIDEPADAPLPRDLVLFRNGLLDLESNELRPHDGRYFATALPEFDYDPNATCPTWDRCMNEWLDSSFHPTLDEFMGYATTPDTRYEKLLALIGARRGGKSTVLRVLSWLVGESHVLSRTMNDLAEGFGLEGALDAKLLLIPDAHDTDTNKRSIALDRLKSITGQDEISVNRKGLKMITARVPARIVIAANRHPKFLDDSGALAARELVLVFERSFEGREDRDLSSKLRAELPGIANRALAGLRRLRANGGKFTVGAKGRAAARELAESQSPALRFAKSRLVVTGDLNDRVSLPDVFNAYQDWAFAEGLGGREIRNRDDLKNDLVAALATRGVVHDRRRWHDPTKPRVGEGKPMRGFFGLKLRERAD
jgi:P4 family phage/plasmid primase-like protien